MQSSALDLNTYSVPFSTQLKSQWCGKAASLHFAKTLVKLLCSLKCPMASFGTAEKALCGCVCMDMNANKTRRERSRNLYYLSHFAKTVFRHKTRV